jgi:hypothetical protein
VFYYLVGQLTVWTLCNLKRSFSTLVNFCNVQIIPYKHGTKGIDCTSQESSEIVFHCWSKICPIMDFKGSFEGIHHHWNWKKTPECLQEQFGRLRWGQVALDENFLIASEWRKEYSQSSFLKKNFNIFWLLCSFPSFLYLKLKQNY